MRIYSDCLSQRNRLLLFFTGWGMDEKPFLRLIPPGMDYAVCYNYQSLDFRLDLLRKYASVKIVAWSMGVWAASQALQNVEIPLEEAIAVNGTPFPVDDQFGIPADVFRLTLQSLDEHTLYKFRKRMCGSKVELTRFLEVAPTRGIIDLRMELQRIGELAATVPASSFTWTKAFVGVEDKIFPVANQRRAWAGVETIQTSDHHYPTSVWKQVFR